MLKSLLIKLQNGEGVMLESYKTVYVWGFAEEVPYETLYFNKGRWIIERLNCFSAIDLGLGTCNCNSHPTFLEETISRKEALLLLKKYIQQKQAEREAASREMAWLDEAIASAE